jgi:hypothetical protein
MESLGPLVLALELLLGVQVSEQKSVMLHNANNISW